VDDTGQIDFVVRRFQECARRLEDLELKTKDISESLDALNVFMEATNGAIGQILGKLECVQKKHDDEKSKSQELFQNNACFASQITAKNEELNKKAEASENAISTLESRIDDFSAQLRLSASIEQVLSVSQAILDLESFCRSQLKEVPNLIAPLFDIGKGHSERLEHQNSSLSTLLNMNQACSSQIEDLRNKFQISFNENEAIKQRINSVEAASQAYVDDKIKNIPATYVPSMDEIKKEVKNFLEPTIRESQNAALRSTNCDTKLILLERKIDQVQMLVNKIEMEKKL
jgi:chromosome segregation ATPase